MAQEDPIIAQWTAEANNPDLLDFPAAMSAMPAGMWGRAARQHNPQRPQGAGRRPGRDT